MSKRPSSGSLLHPRHWPSWLVVGLLRLLLLLPYPVVMAFGRGLGKLVGRFAWRTAIARTNLRLCFPESSEAERERLLTRHFEAIGMGAMEIGIGWWWSARRTDPLLLGVEGLENLPPADDDRGTILLTAHFSSLELSGLYIAQHYPSHAMYRRNENPVVQWLFERYRDQPPVLGIIDRDDVRGMLKVLKDGGGVWFAPDQNFAHKGGVFADFMGVPAATNTATSRFAKMTGARVIPFVVFRERGGYRLVIEPALDNFPSDDVATDTQRINDIFNRWVARAPEQYNWIHRRFKTRPEGSPAVYR